MIYLDHGATSFPKPRPVRQAMVDAMDRCANPGRSGHRPAMEAARVVYGCRERAAALFHCQPEQVVFTANCTHGLNIAIRTLVQHGSRVLISGFEHNAVTRPLYGLGARVEVAGRRLFDWEDTLSRFEDGLKQRPAAAVFTHVSNVFGYVLPVEEMAVLCHQYGVPFIVDAAQSAGIEAVDFAQWGADFVAMPGHKGLQGPMGTGLLLCKDRVAPFLYGGTGSESRNPEMPEFLPDRLEPGTLNVPGIAGLEAGMESVMELGLEHIRCREQQEVRCCARGLERLGHRVYTGPHQGGTISFVPPGDGEALAQWLGDRGICVRAGLHCAPLAHESAGTLETGTVRVSFGCGAEPSQTRRFLEILGKWKP